MSFVTGLLGGDVLKTVAVAVDKQFTSDEERTEKQLEAIKAQREFDYRENQLIAQQNIAQTEVNKAEAGNPNLFVAGWRPAIGWVGAIALFYQYVVYPILRMTPIARDAPKMENDQLMPLITGMLGIAGLRSFDKLKGHDTKNIG